jgi:hypothetical protein
MCSISSLNSSSSGSTKSHHSPNHQYWHRSLSQVCPDPFHWLMTLCGLVGRLEELAACNFQGRCNITLKIEPVGSSEPVAETQKTTIVNLLLPVKSSRFSLCCVWCDTLHCCIQHHDLRVFHISLHCLCVRLCTCACGWVALPHGGEIISGLPDDCTA